MPLRVLILFNVILSLSYLSSCRSEPEIKTYAACVERYDFENEDCLYKGYTEYWIKEDSVACITRGRSPIYAYSKKGDSLSLKMVYQDTSILYQYLRIIKTEKGGFIQRLRLDSNKVRGQWDLFKELDLKGSDFREFELTLDAYYERASKVDCECPPRPESDLNDTLPPVELRLLEDTIIRRRNPGD